MVSLLQESTTWLFQHSYMYLEMPKSLIVSQLPQLHQDADAFPLPIRLTVFEASTDGEQEPRDICRHNLAHTAHHNTVVSYRQSLS